MTDRVDWVLEKEGDKLIRPCARLRSRVTVPFKDEVLGAGLQSWWRPIRRDPSSQQKTCTSADYSSQIYLVRTMFTPAPPSPAAISLAHSRSPKAGALPHFPPMCRTAQTPSAPRSSFPTCRQREIGRA